MLWVGLEALSIDDDSALITARVHALDALTALSVIEARLRRTAPKGHVYDDGTGGEAGGSASGGSVRHSARPSHETHDARQNVRRAVVARLIAGV